MCPKKHFGLKYIFQTNFLPIRLAKLSKNYPDVWRKVSGLDFQNCNYMSIATSSWITFSLKKKVFFSMPSSVFEQRFVRILANFLLQIWQERIFYVQMNISQNITFLAKLIILNVSGFWAVSFWDLVRSSNRVAKTSHCMLGGSCEEKQLLKKIAELFSDCEWNVFGWTFEKTCDVSRGIFLRKKDSFLKNHVVFGSMQKFSST